MPFAAILSALLLGAAPPPVPAADPVDLQLIAKSQALMDAIGRGDKAVWNDTLADDCLLTDEEANVRTKAQIVAEIRPLPPGVLGSIRVENPRVIRVQDAAIVTYEAREHEVLQGQALDSHYHTTDTYLRINGQWKLIGSQTSILPSEAKPVGPPAPLDQFTGRYQLGDEPTVTITAKDGTLMTTRGTAAPEAMIALGGDHFARKGRNRGERIFLRDAAGRVTGFTDRRDNNDLIFTRAGA